MGSFKRQSTIFDHSHSDGSSFSYILVFIVFIACCTFLSKLYCQTKKEKREQFSEEDKYLESRTSLLKQDNLEVSFNFVL